MKVRALRGIPSLRLLDGRVVSVVPGTVYEVAGDARTAAEIAAGFLVVLPDAPVPSSVAQAPAPPAEPVVARQPRRRRPDPIQPPLPEPPEPAVVVAAPAGEGYDAGEPPRVE